MFLWSYINRGGAGRNFHNLEDYNLKESPMSLREEFEKAFDEVYGASDPRVLDVSTFKGFFRDGDIKIALWAARWAMERCAQESDKIEGDSLDICQHECIASKLRQLAKELSNDPLS